jgi:hypothetical protein
VDPVPDPLLLRKSGSAGNRTRTEFNNIHALNTIEKDKLVNFKRHSRPDIHTYRLPSVKPLKNILDLALICIFVKNGVFWDVTLCGSCNIPESTILHSHRRENLKSYIEYLS